MKCNTKNFPKKINNLYKCFLPAIFYANLYLFINVLASAQNLVRLPFSLYNFDLLITYKVFLSSIFLKKFQPTLIYLILCIYTSNRTSFSFRRTKHIVPKTEYTLRGFTAKQYIMYPSTLAQQYKDQILHIAATDNHIMKFPHKHARNALKSQIVEPKQ